MSIADGLKSLQTDFEACQIAAYADLSTKMVLSSSSDSPVPQEQLDQLCAKAATVMNGVSGQAVAAMLSSSQEARIDEVVSLHGADTYFMVRSATDPDEAICCLCSQDVDVSAFSAAVKAKLAGTEE